MGETMQKSRRIYTGRIVTLRVDEVSLQDGRTSQREVVSHPGAVAIVACPQRERILLVRQYRYAIGEMTWELPAGLIETEEEPQETALRELEEETGFGAGRIVHLLSIYTSPGFSDEKIHLYQATNLFPASGHHRPDADEDIRAQTFSLAEVRTMIREGEVVDAKTVTGVLAYLASAPD